MQGIHSKKAAVYVSKQSLPQISFLLACHPLLLKYKTSFLLDLKRLLNNESGLGE